MADGFGYGGFSGIPYPYGLSSPSPHHPASAPLFLASHPVESYDPTQGGFDPMISHGSYRRSPPDWSNNPSYRENPRSQTPASSFYAGNSRLGNCGLRGEDFFIDMFPLYSSSESSSHYVPLPIENFSDRLNLNFVPTYNSATSATVSSLAEMPVRSSEQPFNKPIAPSGVYASSNALDEKHPGHYHHGYVKPESMNVVPGPPVEPYICVTDIIPSLPMSSLTTQALLSQTGIHVEDGISFPSYSDVCSHAPEDIIGVHPSFHGSSVEPVNFNALLGHGEATGHIKPFPKNSDLRYQMVSSSGSRSPPSSHPLHFNINSSGSLFNDKLEGSGVSSLYQRPKTLLADSDNGVSESSLKNGIEYLNCDEKGSWNDVMVSSEGPSAPIMFSMGSEPCGEMKADNGTARSAVNYKTPLKASAIQPSEDVEANQKPCKPQDQIFDIMNRYKKTSLLTDLGLKGSSRSNADDISTGRSPERHLCDQRDFPSTTSSPRVSSVVNAMHNLSEVLVFECLNGSCLKLEQLENLEKVIENLTKCLKKITANKTIAGEASLPTKAMHVTCPNVVYLNEAPTGVAKDLQGFNVKPLDSFGFKELVDKNEITQSIKNMLASNFPDGEENNPQTLLYKNLWLETEAALCSTTCMARFHRIKNEIGDLKLHKRDASTFMQEPFLNPEESVLNNAEQEATELLTKHESYCGNNVVRKSNDAPQSSRFNSDPVDAVVSLMARSFTSGLEQKNHGNFMPVAATFGKILDTIHQEPLASTAEDKCNDVIDRFQILKQQETKRKLMSQNFPETKIGDHESQNNPEASEMARFGRRSHVSDVMDRFEILKSREAEQVQKSLNSLDIDSYSDNDQPRNKTQMRSASMMTGLHEFNSQTETCVNTDPPPSGVGYDSPTSDWEHVLKDD